MKRILSLEEMVTKYAKSIGSDKTFTAKQCTDFLWKEYPISYFKYWGALPYIFDTDSVLMILKKITKTANNGDNKK